MPSGRVSGPDRPPPGGRAASASRLAGTGRALEARAALEGAAAAFADDYGTVSLGPVVVVLAALDEAPSIAAVVRAIPAQVAGVPVRCLVVDDGSSDGTGSQARTAGALVCRLDRNVGQGEALKLGYRLAVERGAEVIATLDADGQFRPEELPRLVGPVVEGRADFVNGSRRLGRSETGDLLRRAGIVTFAWLVSLLAGRRITDPANGFRAFRAEVAASVPLRQAQYQTAELLLGALALGFKVIEAPVTVTARTAGVSKKGANVLYGYRFARVVVSTWWSLRKLEERRSSGRAG